MEGGKQSGSSLASDLFGAKDSSAAASSSGIFNSIFPPPQKVVGRDSFQYSETEKKISSQNPTWTAKSGVSERNGEGQIQSTASKDMGSYYPEEKPQPFHYSSSIYYGGQDVYSRPESAQNPGTTFNKDGGEDDSGSASRGNWWQGSLYY
ncbi:hypothetical protein C2S52_019474 [Perilla frutescens var. hirtella]|uniref:Uncharacterized protein n=1 Tax=Perilla frutescens var. hirtella TaxID=608512 RepID=A0AAD4NYY8_PERFH|nr:hypothetical protein C2S52_019474 [Perilla frutescens var. hirtella]KAH6806257.1 hypothetical protein C2S51_031088 [Perilla frutescens var. frutescens]KAH6820166.1 hypothetical protein C2S53_018543 [Perilla frutescens var. hirtella]